MGRRRQIAPRVAPRGAARESARIVHRSGAGRGGYDQLTNKFVFDESSHALLKVVGYAHTWEQLAPGIRVRRRVVRPPGEDERGPIGAWNSTFHADSDQFGPER